MNYSARPHLFFIPLFVIGLALAAWAYISIDRSGSEAEEPITTSHEDRDKDATKQARSEFFYRMLRDPQTQTIPSNIRRRELAYASTLPKRGHSPAKGGVMQLFNWHEAGPHDLGGRTRAVAVDRTNANVILAGGVAGGIWKSTDGGASWSIKTRPEDPAGVTFITQDPTDSNRWYATAGEYLGSNPDRGAKAFYFGPGFFTSTDNGETWDLVEITQNPTEFDSPFDFASKILVSPTTGSVFIASNGYSLIRTSPIDRKLTQVLGKTTFPIWTDFDIDSNGAIIAVTSEGFQPSSEAEKPGVFYSTDDGVNWQDLTPDDYPAAPDRSVIAFAPSDPDVAYMWTFTGVSNSSSNAFGQEEEMLFYAFDLSAGTSENRTANLPDFGGQVGQLYSQAGFDMAIAVKPDDPDFVLIGGTNLFRSRDGFATPANSLTENWIGGYATLNNISQYANHHADQHALFFAPQNPNALWSGHDGGLSYLPDVTSTSNTVPWQTKNDGFNVTQFFHVAIANEGGDDRIFGGTQDNGSPFFRFDDVSMTSTISTDLTFGDGGHAFLGATYALGSNQEGKLQAFQYDETGDLQFIGVITPSGAANQLFVNPLAVDRLDESILYYPGGRVLWRRQPGTPASANWDQLTNFGVPEGFDITALESGVHGAASVVYAGASGDQQPMLLRLDDAGTSTAAATMLTLPAAAGAYIHDIAVNPNNGDEILVAISNYNIVGLYHSSDAGATFTEVEGNLTGDAEQPGPSIRSVAILPLGTATAYLAGTSTGLYTTETLSGAATSWVQEATESLGHTIVESIATRPSDGRVVVATHGRGIFVGLPLQPVANEPETDARPHIFTLDQNYPNPFNPSTTLSFTLSEPSTVTLVVIDVTGRQIDTLLDKALKEPGSHTVPFHAGALPSGAYLYRLEASPLSGSDQTYSAGKTMILSK